MNYKKASVLPGPLSLQFSFPPLLSAPPAPTDFLSVPPVNNPFLHFYLEKGRPPIVINKTYHIKLQQEPPLNLPGTLKDDPSYD